MITVYGLCYRILDYAQKTVDRLRETASEDFNFVCIESKSCNSEKFLPWALQELKNKKIQRFLACTTNCRLYGFRYAIENFPPDDSEDFFVMTELDVLVPKNVDWIKEIRNKMQNNVISGFTLSNENYVKPNAGWDEKSNIKNKQFGVWLMGIKKDIFLKGLNTLNGELTDVKIVSFMSKNGEKDIIDQKLYHLGWDSWKDDPDYWDYKLKTMDRWQTKKCKSEESIITEFKNYENI
jgi:hypothetical protein